MVAETRKVAIIPARGGSKRIPNKNIRNFLGIPSILRTIKILENSEVFDLIVVSSDSLEILELIANTCAQGVHRPIELALDLTPTVPVVAHAIQSLSIQPDDLVCCVYPVNPFLKVSTIWDGLKLIEKDSFADYVCPVVSFPYPPQRALIKNSSGILNFVNPEAAWTRSQDLEELCHDAGQWYWARAKTWTSGKPMLSNTLGVEIPRWESQDIDTEEDWAAAELLYEVLSRKGME